MKFLFIFPKIVLTGGVILSGCATVYAPITPYAPIIDKGQVEVVVGLEGHGSGEVKAAWSPSAPSADGRVQHPASGRRGLLD